MFKKLSKNNEGFTIIEVLIVLAIAGLILLIVFLAVPNLRRNARNTQRRDDIAAMLGAVSEYSNNNNGSNPTDQTTLNTAIANGSYGYFKGNPVATYKSGAQTNPADDSVWVAFGAKCSSGNSVAGSSRQIAVLYSSEGSGGALTAACQDS